MTNENLLLLLYGLFGVGATLLLCYVMLREMISERRNRDQHSALIRAMKILRGPILGKKAVAPMPTRPQTTVTVLNAEAKKKVPDRDHVRV